MPGDELYAFHGSMVQLASGRIILPAYTNFSHNYVGRPRGVGHGWLPEYCATHMLYSDDEGKTWGHTGGLFMWKDMGQGGHVDCNEACVADTADGRVPAGAQLEHAILRRARATAARAGVWSSSATYRRGCRCAQADPSTETC
jgi:hypothetical protein